jgi:hypothetical protein
MVEREFIARLVAEARKAMTGNGEVYLVKLLREREGGVSEAYERLGRAVPLALLSIPDVPTLAELGSEALETPWVAILHGESATLVPISRFTEHG